MDLLIKYAIGGAHKRGNAIGNTRPGANYYNLSLHILNGGPTVYYLFSGQTSVNA